jgi:hypothetical protein
VLPPFNIYLDCYWQNFVASVAGVENYFRLIFFYKKIVCSDCLLRFCSVSQTHLFIRGFELRHFLSQPFPLNLVAYDHSHTAEF